MSENNIDAFCINLAENTIYAANKVGEILSIDVDRFTINNRVQIHVGSINAIAVHPKQDYLVTLGNDGHVSVCKIEHNKVKLLHFIKVRDVKPEFDLFRGGPTTSQAIAFHPEKLRFAGRAGTGGVFEAVFFLLTQ